MVATGPHGIVTFLDRASEPADLVVVDLDEGGPEVLEELAAARERGLLPRRVLGYFSHVSQEVGAAARDAGVEVYPRGRFWRELTSLLTAEGEGRSD